VAVALFVPVALFVAAGLVVAFLVAPALFVATGFEELPVVAEVVEDDEADAEELVPVVPITEPPAMLIVLVADNCGGVIANTAPRPPTVPPAISSARFISYPHFLLRTA
jgi:hypothetical protein